MRSGFIIIQLADDQDFTFTVLKAVIDSLTACGREDRHTDVIPEHHG
ncbi:Uncharacterised protein [Vibrio cholerae]|nr:Uncharacterised protein [Vibrio cholerae]